MYQSYYQIIKVLFFEFSGYIMPMVIILIALLILQNIHAQAKTFDHGMA